MIFLENLHDPLQNERHNSQIRHETFTLPPVRCSWHDRPSLYPSDFVPSADAVDAVEFDERSREEGPITVHPPLNCPPPPPFHVDSAVVPRLNPRSKNWRIKSGDRNPRGIASITVSDLIHNYLFKFDAQVQCLAMKWWTHRAYRTRDVQIRALLHLPLHDALHKQLARINHQVELHSTNSPFVW